jgi:hypothetical protein
MVVFPFSVREDYWSTFCLQEEDVEFLYNYLLEKEIPLTSRELTEALVKERIQLEMKALEQQRSSKGDVYLPNKQYKPDQQLVFPAFGWKQGSVMSVRPGCNPELGEFEVIQVVLEDGEKKELAARLETHALNTPPDLTSVGEILDTRQVMKRYEDDLILNLEAELDKRPDFVRIAGRWFPRTLLVDINAGHLNLAEAVLDMAGGGPLSTSALIEQVGLSLTENPKLVDFSLDLALQEDPRFDEVGPAGEVVWFLKRLEPPEVNQPPAHLRYSEIEYERALLTPAMLDLEREIDDELSPVGPKSSEDEVEIRLIYPHWRSGTLPLSARMRHLFPTAYETTHIRFMLVDGESGEKFPGWVVRPKRYVFGLKEWYEAHGVMPGSLVWVRKGERSGEVIVRCEARRSSRDWIRTLLVGSDGGIVFAMLKQAVSVAYDERMGIAVRDPDAVDLVGQRMQKERTPFERVVANTVRELAKLNPQSHVHASELYAAVNVLRRCPPGPILALLTSRSWFVHVGDLHYRFDDSEQG